MKYLILILCTGCAMVSHPVQSDRYQRFVANQKRYAQERKTLHDSLKQTTYKH